MSPIKNFQFSFLNKCSRWVRLWCTKQWKLFNRNEAYQTQIRKLSNFFSWKIFKYDFFEKYVNSLHWWYSFQMNHLVFRKIARNESSIQLRRFWGKSDLLHPVCEGIDAINICTAIIFSQCILNFLFQERRLLF